MLPVRWSTPARTCKHYPPWSLALCSSPHCQVTTCTHGVKASSELILICNTSRRELTIVPYAVDIILSLCLPRDLWMESLVQDITCHLYQMHALLLNLWVNIVHVHVHIHYILSMWLASQNTTFSSLFSFFWFLFLPQIKAPLSIIRLEMSALVCYQGKRTWMTTKNDMRTSPTMRIRMMSTLMNLSMDDSNVATICK